MGLGLVKRVGVVIAVAAATTALGVTVAQAQPITTGSLSFSGDPGDYISGGNSYSYSTANSDVLAVNANSTDNHVEVTVQGANGDNWTLDLAAPSGQALAAGTYSDAARYPFETAAQSGLSLYGDSRGCNTVTGSFAIQDVVFGPQGYVQTLDATYEQHCEGGTAAARGEVHIANPVAPPLLGLGLKVSTNGTASKLDGNAYLSGQVSCNEAASVTVSGQLTEVVHKVIIRANYATPVACTPGAPVNWSATAVPTGTTPFQKGQAVADTTASAPDPTYSGLTASTSSTTVVDLTTVKTPS
ncbi:MAG TPA: hypothetical protein VHZ97_05320 [Pseudonocardiaceae bacterium]|jgi:hypothetical protein|nr:hypothetical protein [Pseudonocardiaceae bacterium]